MSDSEPAKTLLQLEKLLRPAAPIVWWHGPMIYIRMHLYPEQVRNMVSFMMESGYVLLSVVHVEHAQCSGSGREFWWIKSK